MCCCDLQRTRSAAVHVCIRVARVARFMPSRRYQPGVVRFDGLHTLLFPLGTRQTEEIDRGRHGKLSRQAGGEIRQRLNSTMYPIAHTSFQSLSLLVAIAEESVSLACVAAW